MHRLLSLGIRLFVKPVLSAHVPVTLQRFWGAAIGCILLDPKNATYSKVQQAGIPTLMIVPANYDDGRGVLFFHGGGYVMGGFSSHRKLAAAIGDSAAARVWLPDYRLAPEHPHPAALKDALAVYSALLEQGQDPVQFTVAGDSAGAGLALALVLAARDAGLPSPASLVLISPWADTSLSGDTITTHADRDPMLSAGWLRWAANAYTVNTSKTDPGCSPLVADFTGLPPILIHVGSEEILLSDALRLHQKAQSAGVACTLIQHDGLWHVFQLHYGLLEAANNAVAQIGQFINKHMGQSSSSRHTE